MKVWNKYDRDTPREAIDVMRPTVWGNPYSHLPGTTAAYRVSSREEAVAKYETYLLNSPHLLARLPELTGRDLKCCCAPKACHADVLMRYANRSAVLL